GVGSTRHRSAPHPRRPGLQPRHKRPRTAPPPPPAGTALCALPARRGVARAEMRHVVEARGAVIGTAHPAEAALGLGHLDVRRRQFVKEARGQIVGPQSVHAAIGREIDVDAPARPRDADMGETALLLEAGATLVVDRALVGKYAFLPTY